MKLMLYLLKPLFGLMKIMFLILITPIAVLAELLKYYDGGYLHGRRYRRSRRY